jgi:hypothetical protein
MTLSSNEICHSSHSGGHAMTTHEHQNPAAAAADAAAVDAGTVVVPDAAAVAAATFDDVIESSNIQFQLAFLNRIR